MPKILAAVMEKPFLPIQVREFEEPELEMNSAILDVRLSEVCGTDLHLHAGHLADVPYPIIPGHVSVGSLRKIRGNLFDLDERRFHEGDEITFLDVHRTCGVCWYCAVAKASTRCPKRKVYGITYGVADGLAGGWAQSVYLKPNTRCLSLEGVDPQRFMAGGCSLPMAVHAVERAEISLGDIVLVLGSGPVGISIIICALLRGAYRVFCLGAPEARLQVARQIGAHQTKDFTSCTEAERLDWIRDLTAGRGADVTIEATGTPKAVIDAMRYTRDAGRVIIVGQYTNAGDACFNPHLDLNKKHLEVRGCWGVDFSHFHKAVRMMTDPSRSVAWSAIPLKFYGLSEVNAALEDVVAGAACKCLIAPRLR
ncbi:MAG: alcohol dehydrogenase [Acidobacteria bacterium]|nr:MAG: alcohol dehydrogenase [Acidobacteriota bacterium]